MRNLGSNKKGKRPMTKRMQGFTLVEIAIVLVIIGLLLGGILKGQEMITQAKIKNVIAGFSGLIICSANLPDKIAIAVDTQMDDGQRLSGSVRGQLQAAPNPAIDANAQSAGAGGAANYAETGTNTYVLCRAF